MQCLCIVYCAAGAVHAIPGYHAAVDPIATASRVPAAERLNVPTDPLFRLQLASAGLAGPAFAGDNVAAPGVSAAEMAHTHTHSHTHLHLHQPDSSSAAASTLFPPLHPLFASQLLQSSALNLPGIIMLLELTAFAAQILIFIEQKFLCRCYFYM